MRSKVIIKTIEPHARIMCEYLLFKPPQQPDVVGTMYFQELNISILEWIHGNLMNLYYDAYRKYKTFYDDHAVISTRDLSILQWRYRITKEQMFAPPLNEGFYNMGFDFKEVIGHGSLNVDGGMRCAAPGFRLEIAPANHFNNDLYDHFEMYEIRLAINFKNGGVTMININDPISAEQRFAMNREYGHRMIEMAHREQELKTKQKAEYFSKADVIEVKKFKKIYVNLNKIEE